MKNTLSPETIYSAFSKGEFTVARIDDFENGKTAKVRAELKFSDYLTTNNLQEITLKLKMIEKNENIRINIVHIDMNHNTIRLNFSIK
jgi:hypothetical protein